MVNMKKFIILQLAGFGDTLSAITRLPAVKEKYPEHEIVFYLGGYGKSVDFSKEQLEREGYKTNIIKNLNFHNQLPEIRKLIKDNFVSDGDIFEDWSFCDEIFRNEEPPFYKYEMKFPYNYKTNAETEKRDSETVVAIHPLTKSGNAEGFESDVEKGRFWLRTDWKQLCLKLIENDYTLAFVGHGDEDWGLIEELTDEGHKVLDKRMGVEETISYLQTVDAGVFCNSWDWEVTSRVGIPTVCMYTKNHFFIQNHIPHGPSEFWNTCYIETRKKIHYLTHTDKSATVNISAKSIYDKLNYMVKAKESPPFNYDICMISYNDEDYIHNTLENVAPYIRNKFCVVDGGSKDNTVDIIKNTIPNDKLNFKEIKWDNKFDVQKNNAIELAEKKWIVFIDADETYEHLFWNQIDWYIAEATQDGTDCINVSRINTYTDLKDQNSLFEFVQGRGWKVNEFGWINYPDLQQRLFKSNLRYEGHVHEKIKIQTQQTFLVGVHCIHKKTSTKQIESLKLYENIERAIANV